MGGGVGWRGDVRVLTRKVPRIKRPQAHADRPAGCTACAGVVVVGGGVVVVVARAAAAPPAGQVAGAGAAVAAAAAGPQLGGPVLGEIKEVTAIHGGGGLCRALRLLVGQLHWVLRVMMEEQPVCECTCWQASATSL